MKKTLIASSCALMLCFTSCATKQAPQAESQIAAPETEAADEVTSDETSPAEESETEETDSNSEASAEDELLTSEDFPEPENIEEPEIITLEPVEETVEVENEIASEEVEKEEPPELIIVNSNEEKQSENQDQTSEEETLAAVTDGTAAAETAEAAEENQTDDITANDVVVVSNQDSDDISGGIDITDDDDSETNLSDIEKDITPSRSVTLKKFEYLDVTYPGTGWIYMGLTDNSKDLAYFGRKLGTKDTKFSLQARASGTKIIHFYRNDPLTGQYLDDYVEVIITSENGSNKTHVEAPEYKLPVQKKEKSVNKVEAKAEETTEEKETAASSTASPAPAATKTGTQNSAKSSATETAAAKNQTNKTAQTSQATQTEKATQTKESVQTTKANTDSNTKAATTSETTTSETIVTTTTATTTTTSDPVSLLKEAQVLYNEKEYKAALAKLNQFFEYSTDNRDQALYLKGQILEAKSDVRDIKGSIDAYTTLTKNYPASKYWDSANKRIIYLKRFYLEVR